MVPADAGCTHSPLNIAIYRTVLVQAHFVILTLFRSGLGFLIVSIALSETQVQCSPNLVLEIGTQDKEGGLKKTLSCLQDPLS